MMSNAIEALYIFDQRKSVYMLLSGFLAFKTNPEVVNLS